MQGVILAAGRGSRLLASTNGTPKALLKVRGRAIIHHVLDALFAGGVEDAVVVCGYNADALRRAVENLHPCGMKIRFVENPAFDLGNARSLWAAREATGRGFLLAMGDHVIEPALIRLLLNGASDRCRLAVDRDGDAKDATRAKVAADRVIDLGKQIPEWNAIDTGVFWCTQRVFDVLTPELRDGELATVFGALAAAGELDAVDVTGCRWIDIDTPRDLRRAEEMIGADGRLA